MKPRLVPYAALVGSLYACAAPTSDSPQSSDSTSAATGGPSSTTGSEGPSSTTDGGGVSLGSTTAGIGGAVGSVATTSSEATTTATAETSASTSSGSVTSGTTGATTSSTPPADTTLPYAEDFEDGIADGFIDSIDNEQDPLGSWVVLDDESKVYQQQTATSDPSWAVGGDYRWTDQLLTVRMKVNSGIEDFVGIIAVRFSSFDGYAFLEIKNDQVKLRLRNQGSTTDLVVHKFETDLTEGSWHNYALGVKGSDYTVYFDEQAVGTVSNAELTAGGIAFGVTDAVVAFDDLSVTVPQ